MNYKKIAVGLIYSSSDYSCQFNKICGSVIISGNPYDIFFDIYLCNNTSYMDCIENNGDHFRIVENTNAALKEKILEYLLDLSSEYSAKNLFIDVPYITTLINNLDIIHILNE